MTAKEINIEDGREEEILSDQKVKISPADSVGILIETKPGVNFINILCAAFLHEAWLFCANDKKAISQNIFIQNLYKIFAVHQKKL